MFSRFCRLFEKSEPNTARNPTALGESRTLFENDPEKEKAWQQFRVQEQYRHLRERYARWVFRYLLAYSVFVAVLIVAVGFNFKGFELDKLVLSALISSSAASAIGLVLAVTRGLFQG